MVVLIGNLPKLAAERDICRIFQITAGTPVRIIKKKSRSGLMQRFALVPVNEVRSIRKLIKQASGKQWQGRTLIAHEYRHRIGANERRRIDWRTHAWDGVERRLDERRSSLLHA
ncbi:MAG: hypothetical protein RQ736_05370 [Thiogranum sp.]|nr:hypothetical protein [Thiogranum sp.]